MSRPPQAVFDDLLDDIVEDERAATMQRLREQLRDESQLGDGSGVTKFA